MSNMIVYRYDLCGGHSTNHAIHIPREISDRGSISLNEVVGLLQSDNALIDQASVISVFDNELQGYRKWEYEEVIKIETRMFLIIRKILTRYLRLLENLEDKIENLNSDEQGANSSQNSTTSSEDSQTFKFLYSAPLVRDRIKWKLLDKYNLDTTTEMSEIHRIFSSKKVKSMHATINNLRKCLESDTPIVHITSHGYYKNEKYVLAFESCKTLGILEEVPEIAVRGILSQVPTENRIIFLSLCYSDAISQMFVDKGFPCVISVDSQSEVFAEAAQIFSTTFYGKLKLGESIKSAFDEAVAVVESRQLNMQKICCCHHLHKSTCRYKGKIKEKHKELHVQPCQCELQINTALHTNDCELAQDLIDFNNFKEQPDSQENYRVVCCCSPELPHRESQKFYLKGNLDFLNTPFFESPGCETPTISRSVSVREKIEGRGKEMQVFLDSALKYRGMSLFGARGNGKSFFVEKAAQYAHDRGYFQDGVVLIDFAWDLDVKSINSKLAGKLGIITNKLSMITQYLNMRNKLIILDHVDKMYKLNKYNFKRKLNYIIENTHYVKLWIVSRSRIDFQMSNHYELKELDREAAKKIIRDALGDGMYESFKSNYRKYFREFKYSPSVIYRSIPLIKQHTFEEFLKLYSFADLQTPELVMYKTF